MSHKFSRLIATLAPLVLSAVLAQSVAAQDDSAQVPSPRTLKEVRSKLRAPTYSPADRELVAKQALLFIKNMYANRAVKIQDFGPSADAVARLDNMVKKARELKDDEFHVAMQSIFRDLHDLHTFYRAPVPLQCSYVFSPLTFAAVEHEGREIIVAQNLTSITEGIPGNHQKVGMFDQLVAVDGVAINEYMKTARANSQGANKDAMTIRAVQNMTLIDLGSFPVPENDTVTYTFKSDTKTYDVTVNLYAIFADKNCVNAAMNRDMGKKGLKAARFSDFPAEDPKFKLWKKYVVPKAPKKFDADPLDEIAKIVDVKTPSGTMTVLRLFSFMPEKVSSESVIQRIKDILVERREKSIGLLIDLTGNGGGSVVLAEQLLQLFAPTTIEPETFRLLPNQLNLDMFLISNQNAENGWSKDVRNAMESRASFTEPRKVTSIRSANSFGQIWFKPVVVLTDAACYSACDMFTAGMQDHGAASIIGLHESTGAGGANVVSYDVFRAVFQSRGGNNPFLALPGGQSMNVSWRQTIRSGMSFNKTKPVLIENAGVRPNIVVRRTLDDLKNKNSRITAAIYKEMSRLAPNYGSSINLASSLRMNNGASAAWSEQVSGIDTLKIYSEGTEIKKLSTSNSKSAVRIELPIQGEWESKRFSLVGFKAGKIRFRVVREIHWRGEDIKISGRGFLEDLDQPKFLKTFVTQGTQEDAWQTVDNVLRVGKNRTYSSDVVSEIYFPIDLNGVNEPVVLLLNLDLQVESGMDSLSIIARDPDSGEEVYLQTFSSSFSTGNELVGLIVPRRGKRVETVLRFESDDNWNMKGPIVRDIGIQLGMPRQSQAPAQESEISRVLTGKK